MLLSELEMSGPRENSVGARTWASQVGSLDNVAHVIFRHRNLNKHLRFHIIRADGLGCGRGQRGVLKKNLRGRGAYSKKSWILKENLSTPKPTRNTTIGYSKKKMSTPQVPTTTNPGVLKKSLSIPWSIPGQYAWDISQPSPLPPTWGCLSFSDPYHLYMFVRMLWDVCFSKDRMNQHTTPCGKKNASQILHTTVES